MGTITPRASKDGTPSYTVQLRIRRKGQIVHQETQTFARQQAAKAWMKKRETELAAPGALVTLKASDPLLAEVITQHLADLREPATGDRLAKLKANCASSIGKLRCSEVNSQVLIAYGKSFDRAPSTVYGYFSYLAPIFRTARATWGYPLDPGALTEARAVLEENGFIGTSKKRDRRPTLDELDRIMDYLRRRHLRHKGSIPMEWIVPFAIFSARRLGEILRMQWTDIDERRCKLLVYNMKDPKKKIGNHVWVDLTPEALQILRAVPRTDERVFPHGGTSASDAFKEACDATGVRDLNFHDLRHEGVSRMIELEYSIPQVALMSGHKSWANLQRYANELEFGNKFAGWPWLDIVAPLPQLPLGKLVRAV